jgi:hypothetical protein
MPITQPCHDPDHKHLSTMAPIRRRNIASDVSPSNTAQLGMGWDIATGTIDLGLGIFDAIIMVGEWIREYAQKKAVEAKAGIMLRRGKKQGKPNQPRSLNVPEKNIINVTWE